MLKNHKYFFYSSNLISHVGEELQNFPMLFFTCENTALKLMGNTKGFFNLIVKCQTQQCL